MMVTASGLLDTDVLLPGDVVVDGATHKPMQVVGYDQRDAAQVDDVWDSDVNQHRYDIAPSADVVELVDIPRGTHYFVPESVQRYPASRLQRVLPEPATQDRRVQEKLVRAVFSHIIADIRARDADTVADAVLTVCRQHWSDGYVDEIAEFAETVPPRHLTADE